MKEKGEWRSDERGDGQNGENGRRGRAVFIRTPRSSKQQWPAIFGKEQNRTPPWCNAGPSPMQQVDPRGSVAGPLGRTVCPLLLPAAGKDNCRIGSGGITLSDRVSRTGHTQCVSRLRSSCTYIMQASRFVNTHNHTAPSGPCW